MDNIETATAHVVKRREHQAAEGLKQIAAQKIEYALASAEIRKRRKAIYTVEMAEQIRQKIQGKTYKGAGRHTQLALNLFAAVNLLACAVLAVVGYQMGIFTSVESLQEWVNGFGPIAPIIFIVFQAVQVIIPIIPGGASLAGGVVIFGPWWGFVYNYLGICLGSLIVFGISRGCGKPLLYKLFPAKAIQKYERFANDRHRFTKMFAVAIFAPCAPDDMLCYLAGTTDMSWKTYTLIILLGKPASTAMYSLGLTAVLRALMALI